MNYERGLLFFVIYISFMWVFKAIINTVVNVKLKYKTMISIVFIIVLYKV